jgi:hypothetical protein
LSASTTPLFGRKYQLQIAFPASGGNQTVLTLSDSAWEPEALRITFDVTTSWGMKFWSAEICVYNLNEQTANQILSQGANSGASSSPSSSTAQAIPIQQGMEVTLSAGYQAKNQYGVIWDGYVLQAMWERENQTDFKLTLHCLNWLGLLSRNDVNLAFTGNVVTQQQVIAKMAKNSFHPIGVGQVSPSLAGKNLPRGKVVFGNPQKHLWEMARDNNMQVWLGSKGLLNFAGLNDPGIPIANQEAKQYTPTTGIVGTPVQTQKGANFRLLLDPNVGVQVPAMCVAINNAVIRQLQIQPGNLSSLSILSQDGVYVVYAARYVGDSRGNDWYTDVEGWLMAAAKLQSLSQGTGVQIGNG